MLSIVAAVDCSGTLAANGVIPWHCKEDMRNFSRLTANSLCIVGRTTYEQLPLLSNRQLIVLTRHVPVLAANKNAIYCKSIPSLCDRIYRLTNGRHDEVFVIGGRSIYEQLLPFSTRVYLTVINSAEGYEGDIITFPYDQMTGKWRFTEQSRLGDSFYYVLDRVDW